MHDLDVSAVVAINSFSMIRTTITAVTENGLIYKVDCDGIDSVTSSVTSTMNQSVNPDVSLVCLFPTA